MLITLKKRSEFLAVSQRGTRVNTAGIVLQALKREGHTAVLQRVGFTTTRKIGNAVVRNRARRRLREVARLVLPELAQPGFDYVLIGKHSTHDRPMDKLIADLRYALHSLARE